MKIFEELKKRLKAETPDFFKKIRNGSLFVSGLAIAVNTSLIAAQATVPTWFYRVYPYLIAIPAAIAFISQMTKKDKDDDNKQ